MNAKSLIRSALLPLLAAGLFSAGCAKAPQPLIPEGSTIAAIGQYASWRDNPVVREFAATATELQAENMEKLANASGDIPIAPSLLRLFSMNDQEAADRFYDGAKPEWCLWTIGAARLPEDFSEGVITIPPIACVYCFDKPVDLDKLYDEIMGLVMEQIKFMADAEGEEEGEVMSPEELLASFKEGMEDAGISFASIAYKNRPAWRLDIDTEKIGDVQLQGLQPVLATIGDGRLVVMASSMAHLDEIARLYDGDAKPMSADAPLAKQMRLPKDVMGRVAIADIHDVLRRFMPESVYEEFSEAAAENEAVANYVSSARNLRIDIVVDNSAKEIVCQIDLDLADAEDAKGLGELVAAGKGMLTMGVTLATADDPDAAIVGDFLKRLDYRVKDKTVTIDFRYSAEFLRKVFELQNRLEDLEDMSF